MSELRQRRPQTEPQQHVDQSSKQANKQLIKLPSSISNNYQVNHPAASQTSLFIVSFLILLSVRLISAFHTPIQDCDETFNYWEPTHYLLHGYGYQTWEYSPMFGLRSYLYVMLHAIFIMISNAVGLSSFVLPVTVINQSINMSTTQSIKIGEFYAMRVGFAVFCALCETIFIQSIYRRFRRSVAVMTLIFLASSAGMFHASVAYLPSTFTMYFLMLTIASWMVERYVAAIVCMGVCVLIGWPFSVVIGIVLALDTVYRYRFKLQIPIVTGLITAGCCVGSSMLVDHHFYHKWLIAVWNIAMYNSQHSADSEHGANLYGVEPASYYVLNLLLNLNVVAALAVTAPLLAGVFYLIDRDRLHLRFLMYTGGAYIWLAAMFSMPHKEERFLFVIYPLLCFAAAYSAVSSMLIVRHWFCCVTTRRHKHKQDDDDDVIVDNNSQMKTSLSSTLGVGTTLTLAVLSIVVALVSASRVAALVKNYDAPVHIYSSLSVNSEPSFRKLVDSSHSVCVGKEWYRFPGHFFMPNNLRLQYIESEFTGLLPRLYAEESTIRDANRSFGPMWHDRVNGTRVIPPHQNQYNQQERERYVPVHLCDFIVDLDLANQHEPHWSQHVERRVEELVDLVCTTESTWSVIEQRNFLDQAATPSWSRAFYVPRISTQHSEYRPYQLLARVDKRTCERAREIV